MSAKTWNAAEDEFSIYVEDADGNIVADVREPAAPAGSTVEQRMELHRARARLLAIGPEAVESLLLLESFLEFIHGDGSDGGEVTLIPLEKVRAILAKVAPQPLSISRSREPVTQAVLTQGDPRESNPRESRQCPHCNPRPQKQDLRLH